MTFRVPVRVVLVCNVPRIHPGMCCSALCTWPTAGHRREWCPTAARTRPRVRVKHVRRPRHLLRPSCCLGWMRCRVCCSPSQSYGYTQSTYTHTPHTHTNHTHTHTHTHTLTQCFCALPGMHTQTWHARPCHKTARPHETGPACQTAAAIDLGDFTS